MSCDYEQEEMPHSIHSRMIPALIILHIDYTSQSDSYLEGGTQERLIDVCRHVVSPNATMETNTEVVGRILILEGCATAVLISLIHIFRIVK